MSLRLYIRTYLSRVPRSLELNGRQIPLRRLTLCRLNSSLYSVSIFLRSTHHSHNSQISLSNAHWEYSRYGYGQSSVKSYGTAPRANAASKKEKDGTLHSRLSLIERTDLTANSKAHGPQINNAYYYNFEPTNQVTAVVATCHIIHFAVATSKK